MSRSPHGQPRRPIAWLPLLAAGLLAACAQPPRDRGAPAPLGAPPIDPEIARARPAGWPHRLKQRADLNGDGEHETVVLAADVDVDARGRPLWEDGHRWAVLVEHPAGAPPTLLYAAFVPHGTVTAAVGATSAEGGARVVLVERRPERLRVMDLAYHGPGQAQLISDAHYPLHAWLPAL